MIEAYFDGAITFNPGGIMAYGYVITTNKEILKKSKKFNYRVKTNNVAEFYALLKLLNALIKYKNEPISVFGDSQLVIFGITKNYTFKKSPHLAELIDKIKKKIKLFKNIKFFWIPREKNIADEIIRNEINNIPFFPFSQKVAKKIF